MIDFDAFTPWLALAGGSLIGLAAGLLWLGTGRIAGISGIAGAIVQRSGPRQAWPMLFLLGLVGGSLLAHLASGGLFEPRAGYSWWLLLPGAFLVGFGTRLGSGCTSGHGVCGIARLSLRGLMATVTFMVAAIITVFLIRHVF